MSKYSHFTGQPVYSQVLKLLDKEKILQISRETKGCEAYVKRFDGYQHLVVMLFGILKHFDSLRELEIGMKAEAHKLGHLGMNYLVRRSTLAEANIRRSQEFFASVYAYLLEKYAKFLADSRPSKCYKGQTHEPKDWEKLLYMMDSTTITLFDNILKGVLIANLLITVLSRSIKRHCAFSQVVTVVRLMLMYYVDFIAFMENPEKTWNDFFAKEMQKAPPEPSLFD